MQARENEFAIDAIQISGQGHDGGSRVKDIHSLLAAGIERACDFEFAVISGA